MYKSTLATSCAAILAAAMSPASADPTALSQEDLDGITAGGDYEPSSNPPPNGGAIVGNGSSAVLTSEGEVTLSDDVQSEARAMNLVNGSESTVGNGVNVFDGRVDESTEITGAELDVTQTNSVTQDQRRLSSLPGYQRGANIESEFSESGTAESSSSTSVFDQVVDLDRTTIVDSKQTEGSVSLVGGPTFGLEGNIGDATGLDTEFNYPGGGGGSTAGAVFNGGFDYDISAGELEFDMEDEITVGVTLPSLSLDVDAMGCFALNADCDINGERTESTEEIRDRSTLYTLDESASSSETWERSGSESIQAPFELQNAQSEYIVVDESEIDVAASYLVTLSGGAQSGLRAMNVVNAAGSAVANGVNVSRIGAGEMATDAPRQSLNQTNVVNHSR